jgi:hypothetical protein
MGGESDSRGRNLPMRYVSNGVKAYDSDKGDKGRSYVWTSPVISRALATGPAF